MTLIRAAWRDRGFFLMTISPSWSRHDPLPIQLAERLWELSAQGLTRLEADSLGVALATLLLRASNSAPAGRRPDAAWGRGS